jgi:hypothetical protein
VDRKHPVHLPVAGLPMLAHDGTFVCCIVASFDGGRYANDHFALCRA